MKKTDTVPAPKTWDKWDDLTYEQKVAVYVERWELALGRSKENK